MCKGSVGAVAATKTALHDFDFDGSSRLITRSRFGVDWWLALKAYMSDDRLDLNLSIPGDGHYIDY